jgi:hypothetical protein
MLNARVPADGESDGRNESCCEELKYLCIRQFPKEHMKMLGDFNSIVGRNYIFEQTVWNMTLLEINIVNGIRNVNFATSTNLIVEITMLSTEGL